MTKLTSATLAAAAIGALLATNAVAALLVSIASASAAGGETTQTQFASIAQLPVTALSTSVMAETRGAFILEIVCGITVYDGTDPATTSSSTTGEVITIKASRQPKFKAGKG
jgi:hypothetical protein